jgi:hypothetical protein
MHSSQQPAASYLLYTLLYISDNHSFKTSLALPKITVCITVNHICHVLEFNHNNFYRWVWHLGRTFGSYHLGSVGNS